MSNEDITDSYTNCVSIQDRQSNWFPYFEKCIVERRESKLEYCEANKKFLNCINETDFVQDDKGNMELVYKIPKSVGICVKSVNDNKGLCRNLRTLFNKSK